MKSKYSNDLIKRDQSRYKKEKITLKQLAKEEGLKAGQLYYVLYNLDPKASHSNGEKTLEKELKKAIQNIKPLRSKNNIKEAVVTLRPVSGKKKKNIPGLSFFDWLLRRKWVMINYILS